MTGIVVGILALVVVGAFVWSRVTAARTERRSMESYGHALGVLGDVARRSERSASVRIVPREETGRPHVRTDEPDGAFPEAVSPDGDAERLRPGRPSFRLGEVPWEAERPTTSIPAGSDMQFGDDVTWVPADPRRAEPEPAEATAAAGGASAAGSAEGFGGAEPEPRPRRPRAALSAEDLRRQVMLRRAGTGAAAAIAIVALVIAGLQLTHSPKPSAARHHTTGGSHPAAAHHRTTPTSSTVTTTTAPRLLTPTSSSPTLVSFTAPSGSYSLKFTDPGQSDSWIGVKASTDSPTWLWMDTLTPGTVQTYTATGPIVVDLGAPKYVSLTVNGIPAQLPSYALPYYLSFTSGPSSGSA